MLADQRILLVGDECGLSTAVRMIFRDNRTLLTEYEGKALGYNVLEKWAHLGIGAALLPASKVTHLASARSLYDKAGDTVSISFFAIWKPSQVNRQFFPAFAKALQPETS